MDARTRRDPPDIPASRRDMSPLPMRVAKEQRARLDAARGRTGITIQEHVRRAIDLYLAVIEREAIDLGLIDLHGRSDVASQPDIPKVGRK